MSSKTEKNLLANYSRNLREQEQAKKNAQQQASVLYERLQKYLPQQQIASGVRGLNSGSTAALEAQNAYAKAMANAENTFTQNKAKLDEQYQSDLLNYQTNRSSQAYNEMANYVTMMAEDHLTESDDKKLSAEQYTKLQNYINDSSLSSSLTDDDKARLQNTLDLYSDKQRTAEEQSLYDQRTTAIAVPDSWSFETSRWGNDIDFEDDGDNFDIYVDDKTYSVETKGEVDAEDSVISAATSIKNDQIFKYNNKLYLKRGDVIYLIGPQETTRTDYDNLYSLLEE